MALHILLYASHSNWLLLSRRLKLHWTKERPLEAVLTCVSLNVTTVWHNALKLTQKIKMATSCRISSLKNNSLLASKNNRFSILLTVYIDSIYWQCVLTVYIDSVYWQCVLTVYIDSVYWQCILTVYIDSVYWQCVLTVYTDSVYWQCILTVYIDSVYWQCVLIPTLTQVMCWNLTSTTSH